MASSSSSSSPKKKKVSIKDPKKKSKNTKQGSNNVKAENRSNSQKGNVRYVGSTSQPRKGNYVVASGNYQSNGNYPQTGSVRYVGSNVTPGRSTYGGQTRIVGSGHVGVRTSPGRGGYRVASGQPGVRTSPMRGGYTVAKASTGKTARDKLLSGTRESNYYSHTNKMSNPSSSTYVTGGVTQGTLNNYRPGAVSTYVSNNPRSSYGGIRSNNQPAYQSSYVSNPQNTQYMAELERNLGDMRLEGNQLRRDLMANERQIEQISKENQHLQEENASLRSDLQEM